MNSTTATSPGGRSPTDFHDNGAFPFVAREPELARLVAFWQGTVEAQEIRVALVSGEAGIGKSRMLEVLVPRIVALGGVVVHARLYPGASTSIAPILARAIRFRGDSHRLLKKEPDDDIASVITALQRLARLRPVLLVVEDFHILSGEALAEFAILLDALSGEGLSLLALARPMELAARGVLERYLVEEIELAGLSASEIGVLWVRLFGTDPDPDVLATLAEHTLGNTLALRSALRGVLKSGALARDAAGVWRPVIPIAQFGEALDRNIRLLSEGMAAHLADDERTAAERLATLGEVISREAGLLMAAPNVHLVDALVLKGILSEASSSILPLPGGLHADSPLAFTHALLHKHLAESAVAGNAVDVDRLITIIARGVPLYSVLPWRLLAEHANGISARPSELNEWIACSINRAIALDGTPDWSLAMEIIRTVALVFESRAALWGAGADGIRSRILIATLELNRRGDHTPEFLAEVNRLLAMTEHATYAERPEHRLLGFKYLIRAVWRANYERCADIWLEVENLLDTLPALRYTESYVGFLQTMASAAWAVPDEEMLRRIEARLHQIMQDADASQALKDLAWQSIPQYFLNLYADAAELERRLALAADLERRLGVHEVNLQSLKVPMFESIGMPNELRTTIDLLAPRLREQGLLRQYYQCLIIGICQDAWFAEDIGGVIAAALRVRREVPEALRRRFDLGAAYRLARFALLRGEYRQARQILAAFESDIAQLAPHLAVMLAAGEGQLVDVLPDLVANDVPYAELLWLARLCTEGGLDTRTEAIAAVRNTVSGPVLCIEDLVGLACVLDMLELAGQQPANAGMFTDLRDDIRDALVRALDWMAARGFAGVFVPMLARYGRYLGSREQARWMAIGENLRTELQRKEHARARDSRLRVTMLGTIEVHRPGHEPIRPRGARLRTVLGLMVANAMLQKRLGYREFCQLAAGGEDDPERARKMTSMAVLRLRESVGDDFLRANAETPELDLDRVGVDLLDADRLLRQSLRDARAGDLKRALPLLLEAFALIGAEVPFPKLYDDFFEALRADFDFNLREAAIEVGSGLLHEGDPAGAEEVLHRAYDAMPEDEEIADLLCQSLERQGKRVDAERVRKRVDR